MMKIFPVNDLSGRDDIKAVYCENDLPESPALGGDIAIDCEMMGLNFNRDRLASMQLRSAGQKQVYIVHFTDSAFDCPTLKAVLTNSANSFIGHMIRLDLQFIIKYLEIDIQQVFCTRTASRITRTYGASHNLEDIISALLGINIAKSETQSDWGANNLDPAQIRYACEDVMYLHTLKSKLNDMLAREDRLEAADHAMKMIPHRAKIDVMGWQDEDILAFPF